MELVQFAKAAVEWGNLAEVIALSLVLGLGAVAAYSLGIRGVIRFVEERQRGWSMGVVAYGVIGVTGTAVALAFVVFGVLSLVGGS